MGNSLLYPKITKTRRWIDLSGLWKFTFDENEVAENDNWKNGLPSKDLIPVPSSFNDLYAKKGIREYTGDLWYETDFYVPRE